MFLPDFYDTISHFCKIDIGEGRSIWYEREGNGGGGGGSVHEIKKKVHHLQLARSEIPQHAFEKNPSWNKWFSLVKPYETLVHHPLLIFL